MNETMEQLLDEPEGWLTTLQEWLVANRAILVWIVAGLLVLWFFRVLAGRLLRRLRRLRPPRIHPRLARYNIDHAELDRHRREQAKLIIATSTGGRLAGYRIVRQVEAVFVEGFRSPEDALIALKAEAAQRGANGLLNVRTERTAAGRCTAAADAVVIVPFSASPRTNPSDTGSRP